MDESIRTQEISNDEIIDLTLGTFTLSEIDECREACDENSNTSERRSVPETVLCGGMHMYIAACRLQGLEDKEIMKSCKGAIEEKKTIRYPDEKPREGPTSVPNTESAEIIDLTAEQ
jgi:hypothetical protein